MHFFRKYHKWLGIVLTIFILLFAFSGIILNHRQLFSGIDINRNLLPSEYKYNNYNNAAIKGSLKLNSDSILVYGNIGIWLSDSIFTNYQDFNFGFPNGIDHKKIYKLYKTQNNELLAGTLFGLYKYNYSKKLWVKNDKMSSTIMDIHEKQDTVLVLTRSHLYKSLDLNKFTQITLPSPINYNNKVSLFKTLWIIHSGEIFGHAGKIFTDLMGFAFIFLSATGLIYFIAPHIIKRKRKKEKSIKKIIRINRFSLKWHNKSGWILIVFLIITTLTGMFLRPPLLIAIMNSEVNKIPGTVLDSPNAWYDKLRRVIYNETTHEYTFATIDGIFTSKDDFSKNMQAAKAQVPISVMGVNVFDQIAPNIFLIGSFEGLFVWNKTNGEIWDYIEQKPYIPTSRRGAPIGKHMISGFSFDFQGGPIYFDYNTGASPLHHEMNLPEMPLIIQNQQISLWNTALEFHTMRIFNSVIGMFYLLIVPLAGLAILFILISGFIVWFKVHRK